MARPVCKEIHQLRVAAGTAYKLPDAATVAAGASVDVEAPMKTRSGRVLTRRGEPLQRAKGTKTRRKRAPEDAPSTSVQGTEGATQAATQSSISTAVRPALGSQPTPVASLKPPATALPEVAGVEHTQLHHLEMQPPTEAPQPVASGSRSLTATTSSDPGWPRATVDTPPTLSFGGAVVSVIRQSLGASPLTACPINSSPTELATPAGPSTESALPHPPTAGPSRLSSSTPTPPAESNIPPRHRRRRALTFKEYAASLGVEAKSCLFFQDNSETDAVSSASSPQDRRVHRMNDVEKGSAVDEIFQQHMAMREQFGAGQSRKGKERAVDSESDVVLEESREARVADTARTPIPPVKILQTSRLVPQPVTLPVHKRPREDDDTEGEEAAARRDEYAMTLIARPLRLTVKMRRLR